MDPSQFRSYDCQEDKQPATFRIVHTKPSFSLLNHAPCISTWPTYVEGSSNDRDVLTESVDLRNRDIGVLAKGLQDPVFTLDRMGCRRQQCSCGFLAEDKALAAIFHAQKSQLRDERK